MAPNIRLLIIEDNPDIVENLTDFLESKGYILDFAMDGIGGLHLALTQDYDVIVLDLMLPGMDGITLCQKLRQEADKQVPVIMLTARDTLDDKLLGFESGADDYLVKPFALKELEVRIKALAKRRAVENKVLSIADLRMDLGTFEVYRQGKKIDLNNTCVAILKLLMESSPNVVSRKELEYNLWGDMPPGSDVLRSHMYTLRKQIDKPFGHALIETVHGIGFRLKETSS
ncbi:DNA-binding response regulator [Desulfuromonas versatilis]|uniref:DNA-binding response regulator n=1 Tax=Desulfuromonas versatilis TaxID=2802975 RepID=A0ABM8HW93_9BACT|nr:response regulator transcription factor [Desulfuromonas versatilis]BCR06280.1 DNA-binding response regulator [Desulfuromonas versatilis]